MSFRPVFLLSGALGLLTLASSCASPGQEPDPADPDQPAEQQELPPAAPPTLAELEALAAQNAEAALHAMDGCREAYATDADYWLLYAATSQALFDARAADGTLGPGLADDLLSDIGDAYRVALDRGVEDVDVHLALAENRRLAGDDAAAWVAASGALDALAAGDGQIVEAHVAAARYGVAVVAAAVSAGEPVPAAARRAEAELQRCIDEGYDAARMPLSDLYAWQGLRERAATVLAEGLTAAPDDVELYGRLSNLGRDDRDLQVAVLEQLRMDRPDSADALWYLGEARYWTGREARAAADYLKAMECWDRAEESFLQALTLRPDYTETCREWLHLVRTQRGWTLRDEGRSSEAAATFAAALEADSARLEPESSPQSLHLGIDAVTADFYRARDLKQARHFLRRVCAVYDGDPNWTNNLGLFCRDLGVSAAAEGEDERAHTLFVESWEAYSRCVEVSTEDPRLVNDRALIAVYYLDKHHDLAEQELHRSIDLGTARMAEWGEDVPEEERFYVEEAIGDAWENLAYLELIRRQRIGDSPTYLENSVQYYPYENRGGVTRLHKVLAELRARDE